MDKETSFYVGGGASLLSYLCLVFLFFWIFDTSSFRLKVEEEEVAVEVETNLIPTPQPLVREPEEKMEEPAPPVQEEEPLEEAAPLGIKDLFDEINSTVETRKLLSKEYQLPSRRKPEKKAAAIDVGELVSDEERKTAVSQKVEAMQIRRITAKTGETEKEASDGSFDEYYAELHRRLASYWNPLAGDAGKRALILFKIDRDGSFDYYIRGYEGDKGFITRLRETLQLLKVRGLPVPSQPLTLEVNFVAKE